MQTLSLQKIQKTALLIVLVLTVAATLFFPLFVAWSVLAGGMIAVVSLWFSGKGMMQMAESVISATTDMDASQQKEGVAVGKRRGLVLKFWLRIGVTGIVLFVLIRWQLVDIFGLLVGLSTIFLTAMGLSLVVVVRYLVQSNQGRR